MAEDLQSGICGENNKWWRIDSTTSVFPPPPIASSSRSSGGGAVGDTNNNNLLSDDDHSYHHLGFPYEHKPQKNNESDNASANILQMMGYGLSSSTSTNWDHQSLLRENNFNSVLQEETGLDSSNPQIQKGFSSSSSGSIDFLNKEMMNQELSTMSSTITSSRIGLLSNNDGLPIGSASYDCPSTLIQGLYETDPHQLQHSLFTNPSTISYSSKHIELSPIIWSKVSSSSSSSYFLKPSSSSPSLLSSSMAKQQQPPPPPPPTGLHFSNNTPFWNASADALNDMRVGSFVSSSPPPNRTTILFNKCTQLKSEESGLESAKENVSEALKRPRIETPSPLPTFKVRKEKLGDRVTALQQLVSPFGKTDTASVLHEAIEYIKFLQDQVRVLSTPYLKIGGHVQHHQGCDDKKVEAASSEEGKQELRRRGLCLVPISSTFPVATEETTTADLWTPSLCFGGGSFLR